MNIQTDVGLCVPWCWRLIALHSLSANSSKKYHQTMYTTHILLIQ